jgi:uncharacterized membrane protein
MIGGAVCQQLIMPALARLPPPEGIAAMQVINLAAVTPAFMSLFFGTAVVCVAALAGALFRWTEPGAGYAAAGAACYLLGAFLVTVVANVPRNNALAVVSSSSAEGANVWAGYLTGWTRWNHVRTIASLLGAVLLILALLEHGGPS